MLKRGDDRENMTRMVQTAPLAAFDYLGKFDEAIHELGNREARTPPPLNWDSVPADAPKKGRHKAAPQKLLYTQQWVDSELGKLYADKVMINTYDQYLAEIAGYDYATREDPQQVGPSW